MKQLLILAATCLVFIACADDSDDDTTTPTTDPAADSNTADPNSLEGTNPFRLTDWLSTEPVEGVQLCADYSGEEVCGTTDADGLVSLTGTLVSGEIVTLRGDKEGYASFLIETLVPDEIVFPEEPTGWLMVSDTAIALLEGAAGVEADVTKGQLTVLVDLEGALVALDAAADSGPHYLNSSDDFGTEGPFAAEPGITASGFASYFNIEPGQVTISVEAEGYTCVPPLGVAGGTNGQTVAVEADRVTYAALACTAD